MIVMDGERRTEYKRICTTEDVNYEWFARKSLGEDPSVNPLIVSVLQEAIEQANHVYQDDWDLQVYVCYEGGMMKYYPFFVFKFDEIKISNSTGSDIIIDDLYVGIYLRVSGDSIKMSSLQGTRGVMSDSELSSGYLHSHLSSMSSRYVQFFKSFCMGSSGVKQTIMLLDAGWSKELFQMLLFQIEEFVSWESLDGGPHIEFSRVFNKVGRVVTILSLDEILELYKLIDTYLHIDDVEIEIDNSNFTVSDTDKLETALVAILPEKYQVKKTPDGKMFPVVTKKITGKTAKTDIVWKKTETSKYCNNQFS